MRSLMSRSLKLLRKPTRKHNLVTKLQTRLVDRLLDKHRGVYLNAYTV